MNILISNDDGYDKEGLTILKKVLSKYGDVYVSAPSTEKSGSSISLTFRDIIPYSVIDNKTIKVDGTPGDSMALGLNYFENIKFDLCVSGINKGLNEGKDALFSGTVGAGIVSSLSGIKTICLSGDFHESNYEKRAEYILKYIFDNKLLDVAPFLNVNFPKSHYSYKGKGIRVGRIYNIPIEYTHLVDNGDKVFSTIKRNGKKSIYPIDSDMYYSDNGYYSITPFKASFEDESKIDLLKKIIEK
ncbi:hypothetical protein J6Y73_01470 [bacterium]|nr:hypothetical protein [bacterium]